ncbi:MAG TPA: peptide ABC transporter substrate-binding protein [Myxococcales bacterium]|nr:peptide ABC transporter substrate-binding protein [Myxococcales bacterium]
MFGMPRSHWLFLFSIALLIGGCKKEGTAPIPAPSTSAPRKVPEAIFDERIFSFAEAGPESLDPNLIAEGAGNRIGSQMFEPLVLFDAQGGAVQPGQAERWEVNKDGTVYTFYLRKSHWSDGVPIHAADYVYSWERAINPKTNSRGAEHFWVIKGARAYNKGDSRDFKSVGVRALDEQRLQVELAGPSPYFMDLMTYVIFSPVPHHVIKKHGIKWTQPANIVVNGPFRMSEWKLRDHITLTKNPRYWDADKVWLNGIQIYDTESEKTAFDWYVRGKVMWTPGLVPAGKVSELRRSGRSDYHIDPILCVYYYVINMKKPPLDDIRVRRAFNLAIDKGRIVRQLLGQGQKPATHLIPPLFGRTHGYKEARGDNFDPEHGRKLLAEAGYGPKGKPFPKITLVYNTYEGHRLLAEFVQRSLQTHLGVEIAINNMEWRSLLPKLTTGDFQVGRSGWCADFPDPQDFLQVFYTGGHHNYSNYENPAFDRIIDKLRHTRSTTDRNRLSFEAEAILNRDMPVLPLYFYVRGYMLSDFVRGIGDPPQVQGRYLLKRVRFESKAKTQ